MLKQIQNSTIFLIFGEQEKVAKLCCKPLHAKKQIRNEQNVYVQCGIIQQHCRTIHRHLPEYY